MVGDMGSQQFVLTDNSRYQFLVDPVLLFPEADSVGYGNGLVRFFFPYGG